MVQTLPLSNVPFQYLPNSNSAIASYILFSHRQPLGTKLSTTGKRHYTTVAQRTCNGFLIATFFFFWGGEVKKTTMVKNVPRPIVWYRLLLVSWTRSIVPVSYLLPFEHYTGMSN